jgi:hypothetical protein
MMIITHRALIWFPDIAAMHAGTKLARSALGLSVFQYVSISRRQNFIDAEFVPNRN